MKPGITTSEFFAMILFNAGNVASAFAGVLNPQWAVVASSISVGLYGISRGLAKQATAVAPSKLKLLP